MDYETRHILLRDRRDWLGARSGLAVDRDGALALMAVPAPASPIEVPTAYPYVREASGIALGPCDAVFVSDTAHDRIVFVDGACDARFWLAGMRRPRGLALGADALMAADSGHGRVQHFALPGLEPNLAWSTWADPTGVAVDSHGDVLVIDTATGRLRRVGGGLVAPAQLTAPIFVAIGREDRVLVTDAGANQVLLFDSNDAFLLALAGPPGWMPGAIAAHGARIYVADAASGTIHVFDDAGVLHGSVPGYRGPVTAMAVHANGNLYVKPGLDATYHVLDADSAFVASGTVEAGPFDAGEGQAWERARIDATLPEGTACVFAVAQMGAATPGPTAADWRKLPAHDALVAPGSRYLWMRVTLSGSARSTPRVSQARAATPGEDYFDHLPFTYARNDQRADGAEGFLSRLLKLVRGEWSGIEERIDDMPRVTDPQFLQASSLPWLAQWLALELPQIADDDERRELIARAMALFARRGTPGSIAELVELHTGVRPTILDGFADRHVWILGQCSRLDFETQLPALDPNGIVVPDAATGPPCCPGPIGSAVVGESGPLAAQQLGMTLFSEDAYKFCVFVDAYRAQHPGTLEEIRRIVEREKPAHTDYRVELVQPDLRVGFQSRVGIDAIVGGDPPPWRLAATLGFTTRLNPRDGAARVGETTLGDSTLQLT